MGRGCEEKRERGVKRRKGGERKGGREQGRDCRESNPAVMASLCQSQVRVF